jgi:hypothetical protein
MGGYGGYGATRAILIDTIIFFPMGHMVLD